MPRTITLFNSTGDTTVGWSEDQDEKVRQWVADRMAEGYSFFFVDPDGKEIRLRKMDDAVAAGRRIVLSNKDSDQLLWDAKVTIFKVEPDPSGAEVQTSGRAKTPEAVVQGDTVAIPPKKGG